jgi:alpha-L-arabinofuranosidase
MKTKLLTIAFSLAMLSASAQVTVNIDANDKGAKVSPMLYGIFFEDINHAADGGLYAELISNRSFEDSTKEAARWSTYSPFQSSIKTNIVRKNLLNNAQHQALEVNIKASAKFPVCLINEGYWGINAVQGRTYRLSFWAKGKYKGGLKACLCNDDGSKIYAETKIDGQISGKWTKYAVTFTSVGNDPKAQFAFVADGKGVITFDVVSLFPPTFMNRDNGCRPDLAERLLQLKPKFMRFPGGCFVEGQESPNNSFHWERTVGPIEKRPGHLNRNWGYRTSDGMGFHEFLQLSEDIGAKPLYVVNIGIWHGGVTPVDSIQPWVEECLNALEYANGAVTTKYGAMRAANGHPAPFNIQYLEIGNENNQPSGSQLSDNYYKRFSIFKKAVLAKYPDMHIIGNVAAWGTDDPKWENDEKAEYVDEHYYRTPAWFAKHFKKYDSYERGKSDIYCGEYAVTQGFGKIGNLNAALGEATFMMGMENNSDVVKMASYAPIFVNENDEAWQPDMIRFNSSDVMCTPSYYVQRLMSENVGTQMLKSSVSNPYTAETIQLNKPNAIRVGFGSWMTSDSFRDLHVTTLGEPFNDDCTDMNNFDALDGKWTSNNGIISQTDAKPSCLAVNKALIFPKKYSLTCKARKDKGDEGFILVFNYVDEDNYCWLNLGGWGNSQHAIEQVVDGGKIATKYVKGSVETGKWYDVRVDVDEDSITCYLDNKQILACRLEPIVNTNIVVNASMDEKTGEMIVKVVNPGCNATTTKINVKHFNATDARIIRLAGKSGKDENTLQMPTAVYPVETTSKVNDGTLMMDLPPYSLNIIRMK